MDGLILLASKVAWEKGYISEEVKNQLGSLTPEELATAFAIGGVIGIIGTTEAGAAALGPVGGAVGLAYSIKQMAEFDHIADGAAQATNRQQLDKPAQEFGQWMGSLSKDGVLALVGMAGGVLAPRTMPKVDQVLTNKYGQVKQTISEATNTRPPLLGEPIPVTGTTRVPKNIQIDQPNPLGKMPTVLESRAYPKYPTLQLPVNDGEWLGEPGDSGWQSTKPEVNAVTKNEAVPFKDGYVDFSKWSRGRVTLEEVTGINETDFPAADKLFAQQKGWLLKNGKPNAADAERFRKMNRLTWHHVPNSNNLELIPRNLHGKIPHTGSASQNRNIVVE